VAVVLAERKWELFEAEHPAILQLAAAFAGARRGLGGVVPAGRRVKIPHRRQNLLRAVAGRRDLR